MKHRVVSNLLVALAIAAMLAVSVEARAQTDNPAKPGWIADPKTGCKIWNQAPEPHETITWSGPCKDGYADGTGTLQWIENGKKGDRYDGEYGHGKRNGHGIVTEHNGTRVEGDWHDDELQQIGVNEIDLVTPR
jgi:hypothetical protein